MRVQPSPPSPTPHTASPFLQNVFVPISPHPHTNKHGVYTFKYTEDHQRWREGEFAAGKADKGRLRRRRRPVHRLCVCVCCFALIFERWQIVIVRVRRVKEGFERVGDFAKGRREESSAYIQDLYEKLNQDPLQGKSPIPGLKSAQNKKACQGESRGGVVGFFCWCMYMQTGLFWISN